MVLLIKCRALQGVQQGLIFIAFVDGTLWYCSGRGTQVLYGRKVHNYVADNCRESGKVDPFAKAPPVGYTLSSKRVALCNRRCRNMILYDINYHLHHRVHLVVRFWRKIMCAPLARRRFAQAKSSVNWMRPAPLFSHSQSNLHFERYIYVVS